MYYRQQGISITFLNKLDIAALLNRVINTKNPTLFGTKLMSTMVLGLYHDALVDLDNFVGPTKNHFCMQKLPQTDVPKVLKPLYNCRLITQYAVSGILLVPGTQSVY